MRFLLPRSWWSIALWSGGALAALLVFAVWIGFRAGFVERIYTYREGGEVRELEGISRVRTVSWSLPREVKEPDPGADPGAAAIAPATDGRSAAAVLVAARTEDAGRDIFLQELTAAGWTEAVRLQGEINSAADEDSPVLAPSGDVVYFASNRPGGHGGWDLYSSRREGDGWQKPSNLGPRVNSPYDDRTPALDPSGKLLVFSTNRPRSFILSPPAEWSDVPLSAWKAGDEELAFTTRVETDGGKPRWSEVDLVLEAVSGADERDPAFAPGGDFLYFASDRDGGLGGHDLYRARCEVILDGGGPDAEARLVLAPPENLGKPLNSIHDEGDPFLFLNGFAIVYTASDSRGDVEVRFESRTCEVDPEISIGSVPLGVFAANLARIAILVLLGAIFAFLVVLSIRYRRMWRLSLMLRCVAVAVMAHGAMLYGFYFWVVSTTIVALAEKRETRSEVTVERVLEARLSLEAARTDVVSLDVAPPRAALSTEAPPPSARAEIEVALQDALALTAPVVEAFQPEGRTSPPPIEPVVEARLLLPELAIRPDASEDLPAVSPEPARAEPPTPLPGPAPAPLVKEADLAASSMAPSNKALQEAPPARAAAMVVERAPGASRLDAETIIDAAATQAWSPAPAPAVLPPIARHVPGAPPLVTELPVPAQASETSPERSVAAEVVSPAVSTGQSPGAMEGAGPPSVRVTSAAAGSAWRAQAAGILPTPETLASREVPEAFLAPPVAARAVPIAARAPELKLPEPEAVAEVESRSPESGTGPGVASETRPSGASAPLSGKLAAEVPSAAARPESRPITASSTASLAAASASVALLDVRPRPGLLQGAILPRAAPAIARAVHTRLPEADAGPADAGPEAADILTPGAPTARAEKASLGPAAGAPAPPEQVETTPVLTAAASLRTAPGPIRPPRAWTGASANPRTGSTSPEAPASGPAGRPGAALLKLPESAPDPTPLGDLEHVRAPSTRRELLQRGGGTQGSEDAVRKSLEWLARHQSADGHWDVDGFDASCRGCQSPGFQVRCDAAITGLALLAFLGQGHTPKNAESPFQKNVSAAIEWLLRGQTPDGCLARDDLRYTMYTHGIATLALSEAAILCGDERMKEPLRRAARLIIDAQNPKTGGWRYKARPPIRGDTSITGWQVLALVSVRAAGIEVPEKTMEGARHWLDVEVAGGRHGGIYGYSRPDEPRVAMVAEGMFARLLLGAHRNDRNIEEAARYIHTETRGGGHLDNLYLLYYGNLALYHYQGWIWDAWNEEVRDFLLKSQIKTGPQAGSWDPTGPWSEAGGRVLSTSLAVLSLEVYYRYLPLYWTLEPTQK